MVYRGFRHNGGVTSRIDRRDGGVFTREEDEIACGEVAAALAVPRTEVTVFKSDTDPAAQVTVTIPPSPSSPVPPDPDRELAAAIEGATTLAELKAALLGQKSQGKVKGRPV